ncbi:CHC2 zinc finger domain-containing protein [bacterium]|nr:CHC2 zinc finger domain-containing protein [bacterium]
MTVSEAKERVSIADLWSRYGYEGNPSRSCRSPFRDERNPSFSVFAGGYAWKDHGTGDGGDSVTFIQFAEGVSNAEACRKIAGYAGGDVTTPRPARIVSHRKRVKPKLPVFHESTEEKSRLAELRNVSPNAIDLCIERGLIRFGVWKGMQAWFVVDQSKRNAQARRLDGKPWDQINAKAWTLPKSEASWPIGLEESLPYPIVLLVEGGPDLLAAAHFIYCENRESEAAPAAILGAGHRLKQEALIALAGKTIRIFSHADKSGYSSTKRWADQLRSVDAKVDAVSFKGLRKTDESPVGDLNDLCSVHADDFESEAEIRNLVP